MLLLYIVIVLATAGLLCGAELFLKKKNLFPERTPRAIALALGFISLFELLKEWPAVYRVQGLNMYSPFGDAIGQTVLGLFLVWFTYAAVLMVVMDAFFEYKTLRNLVRFFAPLVFLADLAAFGIFLTAHLGTDALTAFDLRLPFLLAQLGIGLFLCARRWIADHSMPEKRDWLNFAYALPFACLTICPCFMPQALFGFANPTLEMADFTEEHRFMIYLSLVIPFIIFHALRKKSDDVKRFLMIYLSLGMFFTYIARWELVDFLDPTNWPLHLCNTAMFLIPLCLIFRMEKLFNFCLFINVIGALLAMMNPGIDDYNIMHTEVVNFWVNHYNAFGMPVLLVALKIFKRPKFKEWCYALIAFAVYFFGVLFLNAWFSNYDECDFFFINSDFISDFVSGFLGAWVSQTRDIVVTVPFFNGMTLTFYPLFQTLFFIFYVAFIGAVWFLYALLFSLWDAAEDRREREKFYQMKKKQIREMTKGKTIAELCGENVVPSLVLRHFSKAYDNNDFYSVNDVSFEVRGGEIFGFLGPNGAGKSTIIKSIVGIQPLSKGDIEVCGFHVEQQAVQAKLQLGFVPDHYALYENLTGREYINYIADLYQVSQEYRDQMITKYVERFQLTDSFDNQMKTYSHGMKQKITIMAALVHNPKVWILDEPLTGLDPNSIHEVKQCMKEHAAAGNIVFFSSHIIDVVEKICDRIAIIKKGKLRACRSVAELEENGIELEQFYLSIINADDQMYDTSVVPQEEPTA